MRKMPVERPIVPPPFIRGSLRPAPKAPSSRQITTPVMRELSAQCSNEDEQNVEHVASHFYGVMLCDATNGALRGTWPRLFDRILRVEHVERARYNHARESCDVFVAYELDLKTDAHLDVAGVVTDGTPSIALMSGASDELVARVLDAGFDDVLPSTVSAIEFEARVRAIQRRRGDGHPLQRPEPTVDHCPPARVNLRRAEANILEYLTARAGRVVSQRELIEQVLGGIHTSDRSLVRVHVAALRKKLGPARDLIRTIRGRGYLVDSDQLTRLRAAPDAPSGWI